MSAVRMLVLGVIRMAGPTHGYHVRRELLSWRADKWANVAPGSIYHALKKLTKDGLLAEADPADKPERTTYSITPAGENELFGLITEAIITPSSDPEPLNAAIAFLPLLPRATAVKLFEQRATQLEASVAAAKYWLDTGTEFGKPAHVAEIPRLWGIHVAASLDWSRDLARRIASGEYSFIDDKTS